MNKDKLIPEIRFPEFKNEGEWLVEKASERSTIVIGGTPSTTIAEYWGGDIGWIGSGELKNGIIRYPTKYITKLGLEKSSTQLLPKGTPVLAMTGATLGKIGLLDFDCCGNQSVAGFIELKNLNSIFLYHQLQKITNQILSFAGGGAQAGINKSNIENLELIIPSIKEQQKIASCLSSLDEVIAAHSQKLELLKNHKKGLMQNLFPQEGEKVPKYRFKEFVSDGNWQERFVDEFFSVGSSKRVLQEDWTNSGVPFYRTRELVSLSKNEPFGSEIFISEDLFLDISEKYGIPTEGDFLVSGVGTLGICYQVKAGDRFYFKDGNVLWFKLDKGIDSTYFKFCFQSDYIQNQIVKQTSISTVGTYTIQNAKKTTLWYPPNLKEQQKIASCLSSLDTLITAQAEKIEQLKLHKKGLMQGLFPKSITN